MNKINYYKNFSMNTELHIAGNFIYDGIRNFNCLNDFYNEDEIFNILYDFSVGIERLQKIAIVLLEEINNQDIEKFEKSLITHSHLELYNRISHSGIENLNKHQNSFLALLSDFYNSSRYHRFIIDNNYSQDKELLVDYLEERLDIEIESEDYFLLTRNNVRIKKFIGRVVGGISKKYYNFIRKKSQELQLYSYEVRTNSPAGKVFLPSYRKNNLSEGIVDEKISLKEFIVFLINPKQTSKIYEFIREIDPLNFDINLINEYIRDISNGKISSCLVDQVESMYMDYDGNIQERIKIMNDFIGNPNIYIEEEEDIED